MNKEKFSNALLLFSLLAAAVIVAAGFVFFLRSVAEPAEVSQMQEEETVLFLLNNFDYYHSYCKIPMKLTDGVFQRTENFLCNQEPTFGFFFRIYNKKIALGDLNFDQRDDAAVVLTTNYGGSGDFRELAVVLNQNGTFQHVASAELGDRVIVNDISILESRIVLDMVIHQPEDGACCPTKKEVVEYELLDNNKLERK